MLVTRVELHRFDIDKTNQRCLGTVGLLAGHDKVVVTCDIAYPGIGSEHDMRRAMAKDAIRQLKRMPEFRSGQSDLTIYQDALA